MPKNEENPVFRLQNPVPPKFEISGKKDPKLDISQSVNGSQSFDAKDYNPELLVKQIATEIHDPNTQNHISIFFPSESVAIQPKDIRSESSLSMKSVKIMKEEYPLRHQNEHLHIKKNIISKENLSPTKYSPTKYSPTKIRSHADFSELVTTIKNENYTDIESTDIENASPFKEDLRIPSNLLKCKKY